MIFALTAVGSLVVVGPAQAVNLKDAFNNSSILDKTGSRSGYNTGERNVEPIIGNIISVILSFLGVIFLILMVYGGYMWMTAMGNEEKVKKAQALIVAAVLGLIIVVGAYAMTVFVVDRMTTSLLSQK